MRYNTRFSRRYPAPFFAGEGLPPVKAVAGAAERSRSTALPFFVASIMENEDNRPKPEELAQRTQWFNGYMNQLENHPVLAAPKEGVSYRCPCCHYKTLSERGGYDICPVCFWEDDGQDDQDADAVRGGPNGALSLTQARENFKASGACDPRSTRHVRRPLPEEL